MNQVDFWYVRLPDGRVLRAASTAVLRQELSARHIPLNSTVRRAPSDEWVSLEWTQEFADVVEDLAAHPPSESRRLPGASRVHAVNGPHSANAAADFAATVGSRLDPERLHFVGVRSYLEELLSALDSTLVAKKMLLGLIVGVLLGTVFLIEPAAWFEHDGRWLTPSRLLLVFCFVAIDVVIGLLTRLSYIELTRLRPARWREGLNGLGQLTASVVVTKMFVWGIAGGSLVLLRWLPFWLGPTPQELEGEGPQILGASAVVVGMVGEVLLYPAFFFWWLLPPLLVVEGCTIGDGLRQWLGLLRRHLGRVLLYQTMAVAVGLLVTAPFLLLIAPLFSSAFHPPEGLEEVTHRTRLCLLGLACAPLLVYWTTSNLFIYLNLRYGGRESAVK